MIRVPAVNAMLKNPVEIVAVDDTENKRLGRGENINPPLGRQFLIVPLCMADPYSLLAQTKRRELPADDTSVWNVAARLERFSSFTCQRQ